jgi:hypothetical protein
MPDAPRDPRPGGDADLLSVGLVAYFVLLILIVILLLVLPALY